MEIIKLDWEFDLLKIPATFYKQENSKGLLVVFPGGGYPAAGPVLYYPTNLYLDHGFNVLALDYSFSRFQYNGDKDLFLGKLGQFIFQRITTDFQADQIHLLAKSIGTRIIANAYEALENKLKEKIQKVILLTPAWNQEAILNQLLAIGTKSFHVIGTADNLYDKKIEEILHQKGIAFLVIPNADHGLDIEGNVSQSIVELGKMTLAIGQFANLK